MHNLPLRLMSALVLPSLLTAQLEIATRFATAPNIDYGNKVLGIGDGNGDGVPDFLVLSSVFSGSWNSRVHLISGADQTVLGQASYPSLQFGLVLASTGDLDMDGHRDFVVGSHATLRAYSGADASLIWTSPMLAEFHSACGIGDIDTDGRADLVVAVKINGTPRLATMRGSDGVQLTISAPTWNAEDLTSLGDINSDGHHEVVLLTSSNATVYTTVPLAPTVTVTPQLNSLKRVEAANIAGDARNEFIITRGQRLYCCDPTSGQVLRTETTQQTEFTVVGDLNGDSYDDLAVYDTNDRHGSTPDNIVAFISGATGQYLADWPHSPQLRMQVMRGIGDVDGDGYDDLLMGDKDAGPAGWGGDGGYQVISGQIIATTRVMPAPCYNTPFPPELGMTRPILGQTANIVGRDGPPTAWGVVAFSPTPQNPTSLGFSGCTAWFDVSNGILLHQQPPATNWTTNFPIPNVPQLAGTNIALQAFYFPTNSPIGIDLTNGIWARIGS